jgi:hypothetical protein
MSVQKKSLISSAKSTNARTADDSSSAGAGKTMKVAALRHSALKKSFKKLSKG